MRLNELRGVGWGRAEPSSVVDDYSSPANIGVFFADKYQDLYTSSR